MSIDLERRPVVGRCAGNSPRVGCPAGNLFWFVILGVSLVVLGTVALGSAVIASLAVAVVIGVLLLLGGVVESGGAFWCRGWSGFFLELLWRVLSIVVGLLFLRAPVHALAALTLLVACFLMVSGFFKIVGAGYRFAAWGWALAGGIIDLILGEMIWEELPASGLWVIGLFVGINLMFRGLNWIALGMAVVVTPPGCGSESLPWASLPTRSKGLRTRASSSRSMAAERWDRFWFRHQPHEHPIGGGGDAISLTEPMRLTSEMLDGLRRRAPSIRNTCPWRFAASPSTTLPISRVNR